MNKEIQGPSRWNKPIIGAGAALIVILCAFAAGLSQTDLSEAASKFEKNKADAQKEGLFFTRQEVEARYAIPESENGAKLIQSVLPVLRDLKLDRLKVYSEKQVKSQWPKLVAAINKIEEASHRKSLMFKRNYSNPYATTFPEYSDIKDWVMFLGKLAQRSLEKHDIANAKKYMMLSGYLANSVDQEGLLIGVLVRIACLAIVDREIQRTIATQGKDPAVVKMLDQVLIKLDQPFDLKMPIRMEHWFGSSMVDELLNNPKSYTTMMGGSAMPKVIQYGKYLPKFKTANMSRIHQYYAEAAHSMPTDYSDLVSIQRAFGDMDKAAMKPGMSYSILQIVGPIFSQTGQAIARQMGQLNTLKQAVELLKTGADPANGLPLKGRYAQDLDGKPIRIKKKDSGWVVYSVWTNKVDDGGMEIMGGKGDYVVHLPL